MGEPPLVASVRGRGQVTFAVIATSLTLCAVFVPISFLEGDVGKLFVEFGIVMAAAVLISTYVSLSACPALASKFLRSRAHDPDAAAGGRVAAPTAPFRSGARSPDRRLGVTAVIAALAYVVFAATCRGADAAPRTGARSLCR